jgi:hypothetical protein
VQQAKWKQMSFGALQACGHIVKAEEETHDLIVVQDDLDQLRIGNNEDVIQDEFDLALSQRIVFPVGDEGGVIRLADPIGPGLEFFLVLEVFHLQRAAPLHPIGNAVDPIGQVKASALR